MAKTFPSEEWFEELKENLNSNPQWQESAEDWGVGWNGDFIFEIVPEPEDTLDETLHFFIGMEAGECTEVHRVENLDEEDQGYIQTGKYRYWKQMVTGRLDPMEGLVGGQFEVDGTMSTLMRYEETAGLFMEECTSIDTEFV
jgi:putative sterol carrier protein